MNHQPTTYVAEPVSDATLIRRTWPLQAARQLPATSPAGIASQLPRRDELDHGAHWNPAWVADQLERAARHARNAKELT